VVALEGTLVREKEVQFAQIAHVVSILGQAAAGGNKGTGGKAQATRKAGAKHGAARER